MKTRVQYTISLAVADYNRDFDETQQQTQDAMKEGLEELCQYGIYNEESILVAKNRPTCKVIGMRFMEFDSTNPGHAMAYFEMYLDVNMEYDKFLEMCNLD